MMVVSSSRDPIEIWRRVKTNDPTGEVFGGLQFVSLFSRAFLRSSAAVRDTAEMLARHPYPMGPEAYARQAKAYLQFDSLDRWGEITAPTLVIVGEQDLLTPPWVAREVAGAIPGSRFEVIPGEGPRAWPHRTPRRLQPAGVGVPRGCSPSGVRRARNACRQCDGVRVGSLRPARLFRGPGAGADRSSVLIPAVGEVCGMDTQENRVDEFHRLHATGCFVMPNPWDVGSARVLEQLGFEALATTSAGLAWSLGRGDAQVTLDAVLDHLRLVADAVAVPVNADFRDGYAVEPEGVATNVTMAVDTGIAGLSIEDSSGYDADPLLDFDLSVRRIDAARRAIDQSGTNVLLTGRSEGFVYGRPDIDETIRRLQAYAEAGADCLYAPRIDDLEHVSAIVAAVSPKPVNLLINAPFTTADEAARLGVRRISVGGTLARTAWDGFLKAAEEIAQAGTFTRFQGLPDVEALLG
jgi:2-methylisocitrate lyase-like PEP mutase family enzyme